MGEMQSPPANVWSRNSRLANVVDDDGWSTPLIKNK